MRPDKTDKLELIYDATLSLIKKSGMDAVSVSGIAKEAGMGKGSLYYYVETKNDILDGIAQKTVQRIVDEYQIRLPQEERNVFHKMNLLFCVTETNPFQDGSPNDMHVLFVQPDMYMHQRLNASFMRYLVPVLEGIILEGVQEGVIQSDNPQKAAELIIMTMLMVFDGQLLPDNERKNMMERMDYLADIIEKSLYAPKGSLHFI